MLFGQMPRDVHRIVEDAENFDLPIAPYAKDKQMPALSFAARDMEGRQSGTG